MSPNPNSECFYSVDVETSGPIPGEYSLLSVGACLVPSDNTQAPTAMFSCLVQPISHRADPEAMKVTGLSLEDLERTGQSPLEAMEQFEQWIVQSANGATPVFVGFNASFDWSFVNYYFHRFLGRNPFGFAALDIKSLYMGATHCSWRDTRSSAMTKVLQPTRKGTHDALDDALAQGEWFQLVRKQFRAAPQISKDYEN